MSVSQQCSFIHCCFCLDEDDRNKIMGEFFAAKEAPRLAAASSTREKKRTKEEYLRMMLFMIRPENLHLMTAALGTHETREILDKDIDHNCAGFLVHYCFSSFVRAFMLYRLRRMYCQGPPSNGLCRYKQGDCSMSQCMHRSRACAITSAKQALYGTNRKCRHTRQCMAFQSSIHSFQTSQEEIYL